MSKELRDSKEIKEHKEQKEHKGKKDKDKDKNEEKADTPKMQRVETFNQLDERFQLTSEHDPEHIFPEEYEMIKDLKQQRPELEKESDKFLVTFLCARRHDISETVKLLDKYMKKRKELGLDESIPTLKDEALKKHLESGVIILPKRGIDKHERLVTYIYIAKNKKDTPLNILYAYGFWETQYLIRSEPLKYLRNGCVLVVDFKGFGLGNVDLSPKGIEYSKALSGMFPKRIRKAYLINGGWLLKIISEAARLLLSKKLIDRMEVGNVEGLKNYVPEDILITEYGGKMKFGPKDMIEEAEKIEAAEEAKKRAQPAANTTTTTTTSTDKSVKEVTEDLHNVSVSSASATN